MYTIGYFSKMFHLSRSTLLYYDKIGLLKPSGRSISNYRLYSESDKLRMEQIDLYKKAGVSLKEICTILDSEKKSRISEILENRLKELSEEIKHLKTQQSVIAAILGSDRNVLSTSHMNKEQWVSILKSSGLDDRGMKLWHQAFELTSPVAHRQFMKELGIKEEEINSIVKWCISEG